MKLFKGLLLFQLGAIAALHAQIPTAQDFLDRLERERSGPAAAAKATNSPVAQLRLDLTNFVAQREKLPAPEAAAKWIALVERAPQKAAFSAPRGRPETLSGTELLAALPEPTAWPELEKILGAREVKTASDLALRILSARLNNRMDAANAALDAFAKKSTGPGQYIVESLRDALDRSGVRTKEALLKQLDQLAASTARGESSDASIPQLTPTLTAAEAEEALKKVLPKIKLPVSLEDYRDVDYAWKAALAVVDQLPIPQWALVNSPDAAPLYEALEKKFGAQKSEKEEEDATIPGVTIPGVSFGVRGGYEIQQARMNYLIGLIRRGDVEKAAQIASKINDSELHLSSIYDRQIPANHLSEFYFILLKANPNRDWENLSRAAAEAGRSDEVVALAEASLAKPDLKDQQKKKLRTVLAKAKLADDRVEEALAAFKESEPLSPTELALLGAALKRPELMKQAMTTEGSTRAQFEPHGPIGSFIALILAEHGLPKEGFDHAAKALDGASVGRMGAERTLQMLATIYIQQGRPAEALTLLERSPDWGFEDIAGKLSSGHGARHGYEVRPYSLGYIAAAGLAASGREVEALKVLEAYLREEGGDDRAYELLLKLAGPRATDTLNQLFALDQFEERPLIWRAVIELREGKLEEAEKTARAAIAIDPSDGEQGPGDRLRAYAVLADIRAARGDAKEAEIFRGAVKAIRLSEEADLDFAAGLLRRAIDKYKESLKLFADAYCVQARLAVQMSSIGLHAEAEEHYRRAFELMPDSFGRVESHCFGCEGSFGGEKAQNIAEKVFNDALQKSPNKPQLHYLLGYLRSQQRRHAEALPHFQQAVKLDPNYLNAWKKIAELADEVSLDAKTQDDVTFNILRLDPAGRHGTSYLAHQAHDLARLWNTVKEISAKIPPAPTRLLRLNASAEKLEKAKAARPTVPGMEHYSFDGHSYMPRDPGLSGNPALAIARDQVIAAASHSLAAPDFSMEE